MAVAFVNSGAVATSSSSYTVGSGSNRLLVLVVVGAIDSDDITGANYGGVAMTLVDKLIAGAGSRYSYMFYLLNPASGSNAFDVTGSGFNNGHCADYTGVLQSGQPDVSGKASNTGQTSISKAITTVADNCWLVSHESNRGGSPTLTAGANTTIRNQNGNSSAIADSNGAQTPAGSFSQAFSFGTAPTDAKIIVASFSPAPEAATASDDLSGIGLF